MLYFFNHLSRHVRNGLLLAMLAACPGALHAQSNDVGVPADKVNQPGNLTVTASKTERECPTNIFKVGTDYECAYAMFNKDNKADSSRIIHKFKDANLEDGIKQAEEHNRHFDHWVYVDFGENRHIRSVDIKFEYNSGPSSYKIYVSNTESYTDDSSWKEVGSVTRTKRPDEGIDNGNMWWDHWDLTEGTDVYGRYIKFVFDKNQETEYNENIQCLRVGYHQFATTFEFGSTKGNALLPGESTTLTPVLYDHKGVKMDTPVTVTLLDGDATGTLVKNDDGSYTYTATEGSKYGVITASAEVDGAVFTREYPVSTFYEEDYRFGEGEKPAVTYHNSSVADAKPENIYDGGGKVGDGESIGGVFDLSASSEAKEVDRTVVVKFKYPVDLEAVLLNWGGPSAEYTVEGSSDGSVWETIGQVSHKDEKANFEERFGARGHNDISYIRLHSTKNRSGYGLILREMKVYGTLEPAVPTSVTLTSTLGTALQPGEATEVKAAVYDQRGNEMTLGADATFSVTLKEGTNSGEFTAAEGVYTYTATEGSELGILTATVTVGGKTIACEYPVSTFYLDDYRFGTGETPKVTETTAPDTTSSKSIYDGGKELDSNGGVYLMQDNTDAKDTEHKLMLALQNPVNLEAVILKWDAPSADFKLYSSTDGEEWDLLTEYVNEDGKTGTTDRVGARGHEAVRYLRFVSTRNRTPWGLKLQDMKVYGTLAACEPTSISLTLSNGNALAPKLDYANSTTAEAAVLDQYGHVMPGLTPTVTFTGDTEGYDSATYTYTAREDVATGGTFTASYEGLESVSKDVKVFFVDHYLFNEALEHNKQFSNIDLSRETAKNILFHALSREEIDEYVETSGTGFSYNTHHIIDGTRYPLRGEFGGEFTVYPPATGGDGHFDVTIPLYAPAHVEAICTVWEAAAPTDAVLSVSTDGQTWETVAQFSKARATEVGNVIVRRYAVDRDDVRYIRLETEGMVYPHYGLRLFDIKAYGTYKPLEVTSETQLLLDPYVNLDYIRRGQTADDKETQTLDHPNTVIFHTTSTAEAEHLYPNPLFKDKDGNIFRPTYEQLKHITYTVEGMPESHYIRNKADAEKLTKASIQLLMPGNPHITATYDDGTTTLTAYTDLHAVNHNKMLVWDDVKSKGSIKLTDSEGNEASPTMGEPSALMEGRTPYEGGVSGSVQLCDGDKTYDVIIDLGQVIDIPAVEVYFEGACSRKYDIAFSRDADFADASTQTVHFLRDDRVATVDRPRFDRFFVQVPAYEGESSTVTGSDKKVTNGSTNAIRYIRISNAEKDAAMGDVWGIKLNEVTPYYDPVPQEVESIDFTPFQLVSINGEENAWYTFGRNKKDISKITIDANGKYVVSEYTGKTLPDFGDETKYTFTDRVFLLQKDFHTGDVKPQQYNVNSNGFRDAAEMQTEKGRFATIVDGVALFQQNFTLVMRYTKGEDGAPTETNAAGHPFTLTVPTPKVSKAQVEMYYGHNSETGNDDWYSEGCRFSYNGIDLYHPRLHNLRERVEYTDPNVSASLLAKVKERKDLFTYTHPLTDAGNNLHLGITKEPNYFLNDIDVRVTEGTYSEIFNRTATAHIRKIEVEENAPDGFENNVTTTLCYEKWPDESGSEELVEKFRITLKINSGIHNSVKIWPTGMTDPTWNVLRHTGHTYPDPSEYEYPAGFPVGGHVLTSPLNTDSYDYYYIRVVNKDNVDQCEPFVVSAREVIEGYEIPRVFKRTHGHWWDGQVEAVQKIIDTKPYCKEFKVLMSYLYCFHDEQKHQAAQKDEKEENTPAFTDAPFRAAADHTTNVVKSKAAEWIPGGPGIITGIDEIAGDAQGSVKTGPGYIETENADAMIFRADGVMIASGEGRHEVAGGVYIVRIGNRSKKVIVK